MNISPLAAFIVGVDSICVMVHLTVLVD